MNSIADLPPPCILPPLAQSRRRLAIVSTYDELCGIAGYTRALVRQLEHSFEVTVFDLDQYLLRSPHRAVQKLADKHIRAMAAELAQFDAVNIQLEHGTLGLTARQIVGRFRKLCAAARSVSVTFHTIIPAEPFNWLEFGRRLAHLKISSAFGLLGSFKRAGLLSRGIYTALRRMQPHKPVTVIVHTKRDMRLLHDVFALKDVLHHPLSFVMHEQRDLLRRSVSRQQFPLIAALPDGAKLIGVFGFLSEYKGFDTAIRALRLLPADHHLLLFGGIHPQTIKKRTPIDPYVQKLLDTAYIDRTLLDDFAAKGSGASVQISSQAAYGNLLDSHPKSLLGRVHFMGALSDDAFVSAMALCDAVVFSYLEVGQSASGPISQAVEMGCRVIASRTNTFLQFARYHPGRIEFFDIGNHLELAERVAATSPIDCLQWQPEYSWRSNVEIYEQANTGQRARTPAAPANSGKTVPRAHAHAIAVAP